MDNPSDEVEFGDFNQPPKIAPARSLQFKTKQLVHHATFGDGTVIECRLTEGGSDEEVVVAFPGQGVKTLLASLANLEIKG